jgi:hypothetical protein
MIFKELLKQALDSAPADTWPTYDGMVLDRSDFLTSSQVASCLRQSFFEKNAAQFPHEGFTGNGYTERGHAIEAWLVGKLQYLQTAGYRFFFTGEHQRSFYDPEIGLSGTPDGVMQFPNGKRILLEFKSFDPRSNTTYFPKRKHIWQTVQNMYLINKCLKWDIKEAILLYINASDVFDTHEFVVEYDEKIIAECMARAGMLWEATSPEQLDPEGILTGDCEYCAAFRHCSAYIGTKKLVEAAKGSAGNFLLPLVGEVIPSEDEIKLVERFLVLRDEDLTLAKVYEEVKDAVKVVVRRLGGALIIGDQMLTYSEEPGKKGIDQEAMKKDGIDVALYTKLGRPYGVLKVVKPK